MSWTKRQFVEEAFDEIGYAKYTYDLSPEQLQGALRKLDGMMGTWNGKGIRLGYPLPSSPDGSDLDTETNVPDSANEAIYKNLAIRIAPGIGKTISQDTRLAAREGYKVIMARAARPYPRQLPSNTPMGAGNKPYRNNGRGVFAPIPTDPLLAGDDGPIEFD